MEHLGKISFFSGGRITPSQSERKEIYQQKQQQKQEQREQKLQELIMIGESHPEKILTENNYQE